MLIISLWTFLFVAYVPQTLIVRERVIIKGTVLIMYMCIFADEL